MEAFFMLKVLLIDDEPIIVAGLRKLINWGSLDMEIIGEARDGEEALELANELHPNIIITDIIMPGKSGIDLIKSLKETCYSGYTIILSGHGEFEYAREALKNNVFEYLLKPVDSEQLTEVLKKIKEAEEKRIEECNNIDSIKTKLKKSLPLLTEKFLWELYNGEFTDENSMAEVIELLELDIKQGGYAILGIEIDNISQLTEKHWRNQKPLLKYAIENIVTEISTTNGRSFVNIIGNCVFVMVSEQDTENSQKIFDLANSIKSSLKNYLNVETSIGIGDTYLDLLLVKNSYNEAKLALKYRFVRGMGSIIHIRETAAKQVECSLDTVLEKDLLEKIKYNFPIKEDEFSEKLVNIYLNQCNSKIEMVYTYCYDFCVQLRKVLDSDELISNPLPNPERLGKEIQENQTKADLVNWLTRQLELSCEAVRTAKKLRENDFISEAKEYINNNFSQQLSLNKIAGQVFVSPTHFCTIFKNKVGMGFHEYLMKKRMDEAALLISSQKIKMYEVAEKVGYNNPRYFSEAFKRYFGVIPTEYRQIEKKG